MDKPVRASIIREFLFRGFKICIWSVGSCVVGIVLIEVYQVSPGIAGIATLTICSPAIYESYRLGGDIVRFLILGTYDYKWYSPDDQDGQKKGTQSTDITALLKTAERKIAYLLYFLPPNTSIPRYVLAKSSIFFAWGIEIQMVSRNEVMWSKLEKFSSMLIFSNDTVWLKPNLEDAILKTMPKSQFNDWINNANIVREHL